MFNSLCNLSSFILIISFFMFLVNNSSLFLYLMAMELMLLCSILNFMCYLYFMDCLSAQVFIFYMLTVAVAESAFGLGLLINMFNVKGTINPAVLNDLN